MKKLDIDIENILEERRKSMKLFTENYKPLNMYAIFREDLKMTPGKLAAQAGHAFDIVHDKAKVMRPEITKNYKGSGNGTKICMFAKNLGQLIRAYRDCQKLNIPCELIVDRGHIVLPYFNGEPIVTAIGIGPVYKEEVMEITKRYSLIT